MLRSAWGVEGLDDETARARLRSLIPAAGSEDLLLLQDELGIRDPDDDLPEIAPEARRRRLTAIGECGGGDAPDPGCVCHRRCSLDRPDQRVAVGRLPVGRPPNAFPRADHLPP